MIKNIKTYNQQFNNILQNNVGIISENMLGDETNFNNFMKTEFVEMFEDVILNGTVILLLEGQNWDTVKNWLKDKWSNLKTAVTEFIKKIGQIINAQVLGKFIESVRNQFKNVSQEVIGLFDSMKIAVIKHDLIIDGNKPNYKKISQYVMDICKKENKVDDATIQNIQTASAGLKTESIGLNINKELCFVNNNLNEFLGWGGSKTTKPADTINTNPPSNQNPPAATPAKPTGNNAEDPKSKIITFNVDSKDAEGQNVTKEQLANTGIGIFTKLLLKIGVNDPRAQVALTKIGMMLIGIIVSSIIALVVASGGALAVTGTAGWAFTGVAFSIVSVIAALFFAFGVFLLMCWFRKPYPSLEDYQEYLEAWFKLYPDGKRPQEKKNNFQKPAGTTPQPGWGKYDENRLKKDDTCTLLRKWNKLKNKSESTEENQKIVQNIEAHLLKRNLKPEQFEQERQKCKEKKVVKPVPQQPQGKMVSYKDDQTGKYRTGIETNKNK